MVNWSIGSVVDYVTKMIGTSVPTGLSGTNMNDICQQQIDYCEQYTGVTISNSAIPSKYQGPITDLTMAQILRAKEIQSGGVEQVSLGELSVSEAGGGDNETADKLISQAQQRLKELGRNIRVYKVWGA